MSRGAKVVIVLLFLLVLLSLGLNGYLIWQLLTLRSQALALLERAGALRETALDAISGYRQELRTLQEVTFEYRVQIDETFPVEAVVPFQESLEVPIQTTVPINQEIETAITLRIPQFGLNLPVDVVVPIDLEVPIDLSVPVEIDREVSVRTTVPISLEVPIVIHLADTELMRYVDVLDQGLEDLERALSELWE